MPQLRIIFDLDDTLYPERQFAISGFRACERWLRREHGVSEPVVERMTDLLDAGHMRQLFVHALEERLPGYAPELLEAFIDVYRLHPPEIDLYDDARAALAYFEARGPLGLITDGQEEVQSSKVKALALEPRFANIVYTHALGGRGFSKPHPRAFELTEAALGLQDPGSDGVRFLYVGDNPAKDFVAPNERGWISVQVLRANRIHARAKPAERGDAQYVIDKLTELPALVEKLERS